MAGEDDVETLGGGLLGPAAEAEHPRQAVLRLAIGRDGVDLGLLDELEAVLDSAQEPVGDGQRGRVLRRHVAGFGELGSRPAASP